MKKNSNLIWGIILIVIGVIFGLNALNITNINIFFDGFWTLFIIVPCFISLFKDEKKTGDFIGLLVGICLLLACQNIISFEIFLKLIIPVILVIVGFSFIFKDVVNAKVKKEIKKLTKKNDKEYCAIFGGQNIDFSNEEFDGCNLNAIFGSIKCNLKDAIIKDNNVIDISAIFGGVTIYVPENIKVKITGFPLFGGISDERKNKNKDAKTTIYINATCMFGGVEIK